MTSKTTDQLRRAHPRFIYQAYSAVKKDHRLEVSYKYKTEPDFSFTHVITLPSREQFDDQQVQNLIFHIGLVIGISYWKATCSPAFHIEAGNLESRQIDWLKDLLLNGLGEFFYLNAIDFTIHGFLTITSNSEKALFPVEKKKTTKKDLILVGGGKESVVTLEVLKELSHEKNTFHVGSDPAVEKTTKNAGFTDNLKASSTIDPLLLKLNNNGYLNGHTPFSAFLAFMGICTAALNGFTNVIVSNERSANEESAIFKGVSINHQYSKSYKFEKKFREYISTFITADVNYFSFLRPLYELQIGKMLKNYPQQYLSFRSCNVGINEDLFAKKELTGYFYKLTGLAKSKPFECVGTKKESILAVLLSNQAYEKQ